MSDHPERNLLPIDGFVRELHARIAPLASGSVADYIPELAHADPHAFGIVLVTVGGHRYEVGDTDRPFTIQSVSKPFVFGMALDDRGIDAVLANVGVEPTGDAFNAIVLDKSSGRPLNPMVNAGAIVTSGLVQGSDRPAQLARIFAGLGRFAGRGLAMDAAVFESERSTGHRNRAVAHLMRGFGMMDEDVDGGLDLYFRQCSAVTTCRDLAIMAATLANRGINPLTGCRALKEHHIGHVLSVMSSCGMYDYSGEWMYKIGLPAKSGVSGGLLAVLPGQFGLGVFSPPLDERGNSVRAIRVCEEIATELGVHMFTSQEAGRTTVRRSCSGDEVHSKRVRSPAETQILDLEGYRIRLFELQGDLVFGSIESLSRAVLEGIPNARYVILDCRRIWGVDTAAATLLAKLCLAIADAGPEVFFTHLAAASPARSAIEALLPPGEADLRWRFFEDADAALEEAETLLIASGLPRGEVSGLVELAQHELFDGLADAELALIASKMLVQQFEPGATIFQEGDQADAIYLVASGLVSILAWTGQAGRYQRLCTMGPGVAFGEMAVLDKMPRSTTARAEETSICHVLDRSDFEHLQTEHPGVATTLLRNLASGLSGRLRRANAEIRSLA
jgi:glutaminase